MKKLLYFFFSITIVFQLKAQKVGLNTLNPSEDLHIRTNENKVAIRLDNTKSVENGLNYGIVIGTPIAVSNFSYNPNYIDWTDLDYTKIIASDNNRLFSPALEITPEIAGNLWIQFDFEPTIPSNASITDVIINIEWRRIGTYAGNMVISFWLQKASNNQWLIDFGHEIINSSTDVLISKSKKSLISPVTADMINLNDLYLNCWGLRSFINGTSGLQIDKVWLEVEYAIPADGSENVSWTTGTLEGTFAIAQSEDLLTNQHLKIQENGITELTGLQISQNAGPGKVLTSSDEGRAYWADIPIENGIWINKNDTAYFASGPAQINNEIGDAALVFDKGASRFNNGINMVETDNAVMNTIIDSDNNQVNEEWNIYRNNDEEQSIQPTIRFELDGGDSWINGGGNLGIGTNSPDHPLHIGTVATNGNGAHVTEGGTWTNGSSRDFKENYISVNEQGILENLSKMDIKKWEYKNSDEGYHLGPIAEEFSAAFGLGHDERYISTVDADGVALVSIQALYKRLKEKEMDIEDLKERVGQLESKLEAMLELKESISAIKLEQQDNSKLNK